MKLRFTLRAIENIAAIAEYVRLHTPAAAQRVQDPVVYESVERIILFPHAGRPQQTKDTESSITKQCN